MDLRWGPQKLPLPCHPPAAWLPGLHHDGGLLVSKVSWGYRQRDLTGYKLSESKTLTAVTEISKIKRCADCCNPS